MSQTHQEHIQFIWKVADKLRGPYRPPQYRRVMLPMTVLRRLDCVLAPTKEKVLAQYKELKKGKTKNLEPILNRVAKQNFHNTSKLDFEKLLGDAPNIAANLSSYIKSFSESARNILDHFNFEQEIEKLDDANALYLIVKDFASIDLHPNKVSNTDMGYIFEDLVRRFNEVANEEAGDHFTPREVIKLMVHILFEPDDFMFNTKGIVRKIYDPACGTGGMLSVADEYIKEHNPDANLALFGQEYNDESYAVCGSDMLIKGENVSNIIFGDTLGDGKTKDGHPNEKFHYMLSNPPFGVEWKREQKIVGDEHEKMGFHGRFGAGLPRISDGSLLFLQHMISKFQPSTSSGQDPKISAEGTRLAIVFNGSPLFAGDAGSGESNIRKWIIENDWLEAIIALPDQMFYNTGIFTYIWVVSNRKVKDRKGTVQLINATAMYQKMKKSLGNKRNELSEANISDVVKLYGRFKESDDCKIFNNQDFGYLKITVERPLKLNFQASPERIEILKTQKTFENLATSKKRKDKKAMLKEIEIGQKLQKDILSALAKLDPAKVYKNRDEFLSVLDKILSEAGLSLAAPVKKAIVTALSERDETADVCTDKKGNPEADSDLRDTEIVPLPDTCNLPIKDEDLPNFEDHCEAYLQKEVLPHVPDAWIDYKKTKVGYEIPFNRYFYKYEPPRPLSKIEADIKAIEQDIVKMLADITGSSENEVVGK